MKKNNKGNGIFFIIFSICFFGFFISIFSTIISEAISFGHISMLLPMIFAGIIFLTVVVITFLNGIKAFKNPQNTNIDPTLSYKVQEVNGNKTVFSYCEICGNELEEKDTYCSSCGCKVSK